MPRKNRGAFAEAVRWYRRLAGYTQQELADLSGLSLAAIRSYETSSRQEPRAHSLRQLATALGVTIEQLLTTQPPPPLRPPYAEYRRPTFGSRLDDEPRRARHV